jgi:transposase, IS5 family
LKGETGDRLHAVLCAAGYNFKWLLRMIAKKGVTFLSSLFLRLLGHEYRGGVQSLQDRMGALRRWLVTVSASQTSAMPLRLAANAAF